MALPTMAQWTDGWSRLSIRPSLGQLYANTAHIYRAFGIPAVESGRIRVNWTDGASATSVGTGAGAPHTGAAAQVDDTFNLDQAALASQAYTDIGIKMMGTSFESSRSAEKAMAAIYDLWVTQLVGATDGDDYELWGAESFFAESAVIAAGMVNTTGGALSVLLDKVDVAIGQLPQTGYNVVLCTAAGYAMIKKALRTLGGTSLEHTSQAEYGFTALMYSGAFFFVARQMASKATCPTTSEAFYFFNIGPEGCETTVPDEVFYVDGPKKTVGSFNTVWDIALQGTVIYKSPRAAYQLMTQIA